MLCFMHSSAAPDLTGQVSAELRAEMARRRITVSALAAKLGRPRSWLDRRLSGRVLTLDDIHVIATELGIDPAVLFERTAS